MLWVYFAIVILIMLMVAGALIMATPLRTLMPGYMKEGERTAAEKGMLRLDSIRDANERNSIFLANILTVFDTDRTPADSTQKSMIPNELPPDSLLPASPREIEFMDRMKDREKYNINILAPIAADQMRFYSPGAGAKVSEQTRQAIKARVLTPKESPVNAIADGRVISVQNPAPEGGTAIVIHHDNGFVSRYSHAGTPTVAQGSHVEGGSVIAHGTRGGATGPGWFYIEIWYDGTPLVPARYIEGYGSRPSEEPYTLSGLPMGR